MAIPLNPGVKPFASVSNADGVPVDEMAELVGPETRNLIADRTVSGISTLATATRITGAGVDITLQDWIDVEIRDSSRGLLGSWSIDIDTWRELTAVGNGDTMTAGAAAYDAGGILIGRASTDRVMIQADTFTTTQSNIILEAHGRTHNAGLLGRRLSGSGTNHSKPYLALVRASSLPAEPDGSEFSYDGVTLSHTPEAAQPEFTDPNVVFATIGTHTYFILLQLIFDHNTATWSVETGELRVQNSVSDLGFADSEDATTWSTSQVTTDDQWARIRDSSGSYIYIETRQADASAGSAPSNWNPTTFFNASLAAGTNNASRGSNQDWSSYVFLEIIYQQKNADGDILRDHHIFFPARALRSILTASAATDQRQSVQVSAGVDGEAVWLGEQNARASADANNQRFRINFYREFPDLSRDSQGVRVDVGYSTNPCGIILKWW